MLGIIAVAASASLSTLQILTTGLGGAAAGALSVFAATYLSETTEKKTRLLEAWENSKTAASKKSRSVDGRKRVPTKKEHAHLHRLLAKTNRRAVLSGLVTSSTSIMASLALLIPLVLLSQDYSVTASIIIGIVLLSLLGAFRGIALKQSAVKSAIKMVILGVVIIVASRSLGTYVQKLILKQ